MRKIRRTDYRICPNCGASLDIGERCDCMEKTQPPDRPERAERGLGNTNTYILAKRA